MSNKGIIIRQSMLPVKETIDKIVGVLCNNGVTIYGRIDQQTEAAGKGIKLNPLQFILFGSPQKGGEVMKENPLAALDLPLKVIAWQDDSLKIWVAYNDAGYIRSRFSLSRKAADLIDIDAMITKILK
jgi:uncharacterized protein (DUF302 family)